MTARRTANGEADVSQEPTGIMINKRIARDVFLRSLKLERSYRPATLFRNPGWNFEDYLTLAVSHHLRTRPDFAFLQVGAFDGMSNDPIHPLVQAFGLRGIIVEPQVPAFEALQKRYADHPQVIFVNAAVADANGSRDFYTADSGSIQQASFDRAHLLKHRIPAERIVCQHVRCVTITSLLEEHGIDRLDMVQVDAEGYDAEIVRTIDFERVTPRIILFEHAHLTNGDCDACVGMLASHGYRFMTERRDIIEILEN